MSLRKMLCYCMSLVIKETKCLLIYILDICVSSPMNCLGLAHFFTKRDYIHLGKYTK